MDVVPEREHCRELLLGIATGIRKTGGNNIEKKWWEVAGRKEYAIVLILKKKKKKKIKCHKKLSIIQFWAFQSSPQMTIPSTTIVFHRITHNRF